MGGKHRFPTPFIPMGTNVRRGNAPSVAPSTSTDGTIRCSRSCAPLAISHGRRQRRDGCDGWPSTFRARAPGTARTRTRAATASRRVRRSSAMPHSNSVSSIGFTTNSISGSPNNALTSSYIVSVEHAPRLCFRWNAEVISTTVIDGTHAAESSASITSSTVQPHGA